MNRNCNKFLRSLLLFFCIMFVFNIIVSSIISADFIHTNNCHDDDCKICQIIHIATEFSKIVSYIIAYIVLFNATMPLICIIKAKINERLKET